MFLAKLTLVLLSLLLLPEVRGFQTGAPQSACEAMRPGPPHGDNQAQGTKSPFILVAKKVKRRSKQVRVILKSETDDKFRGLLLMAEVGGARGLGYFIPSQASKALVKSLDCPDLPSTCPEPSACKGTANAVTHSSSQDKQSVAVVWTPPSKANGTVLFRATFVGENSQDNSTWWQGVTSNPVKI